MSDELEEAKEVLMIVHQKCEDLLSIASNRLLNPEIHVVGLKGGIEEIKELVKLYRYQEQAPS